MKPIVVTRELASDGVKVVRGRDWEWDNQDGGSGCLGTIIGEPDNHGWVSVKWDNGDTGRYYRVGGDGKFDLALYNPFQSKPANPFVAGGMIENPQPKVQRLTDVRKSLEASIKKTNSLTEKSNTNGHYSDRATDYDAIKVRRPVIKIQGTKR